MKSSNLLFLVAGLALALVWFASYPMPLQPTEDGSMRMQGMTSIPPGPLGEWVSLGLWWAFLVTATYALMTWVRSLPEKKADDELRRHIHHA
jgi:hypothetical protein